MSPNPEEGKIECDKFFPEDYAETVDEEDMNFGDLSVHSALGNEIEEEAQEELVTEDGNTQGEGNVESPDEDPDKENVADVAPDAPVEPVAPVAPLEE